MPILGIIASQISGHLIPPAGPGSYESIATTTLGSAQSTITFSSIPSTFKHLQVRVFGFGANIGTIFMRVNSDTNTANYRSHFIVGTGASTIAGDLAGRAAYLTAGFTSQFIPTYPSVSITDILDYSNTNKYKTARSLSGSDTNNTGTYNGDIALASGVWFNTTAINRLDLFLDAGNWGTYTSIALYGIKE